jgi:hypothetical protein
MREGLQAVLSALLRALRCAPAQNAEWFAKSMVKHPYTMTHHRVLGPSMLRIVALALVLVTVSITSAQAQNAPKNFVDHADVAITAAAPALQILAANPERVSARCQNRDDAAHDVVIGDATTDNAHGMHVAAQTTVPIKVTGAIFVYSLLGSSAFNCSEIVRAP